MKVGYITCVLALFRTSLGFTSNLASRFSPSLHLHRHRVPKIILLPRLRMSATDSFPKDQAGWRTVLDPMQFAVLREKATEPPSFSEKTPGQLEHDLKQKYGTKYPTDGVYNCVGCGAPLYTAQSKFDSGCGWPAFYEGVPGAIKEVPDADGRRVEIVCNNCNSHLGHVFKGEGFKTPTDERHCVNGICLRYEPSK